MILLGRIGVYPWVLRCQEGSEVNWDHPEVLVPLILLMMTTRDESLLEHKVLSPILSFKKGHF